jgi:16S rRNA (adenine1518-N6/adenine1519-N6)-dimethyltransferase
MLNIMKKNLDTPYAKVSIGQHWLNDEKTLDAMCDGALVEQGDHVLEVGPGHGSLTKKLLERGANVTAVELDQDLIYELKGKFSGAAFRLYIGSILQFDFHSMMPGYKVAANIPYYLTSNFLRLLCESDNPFSLAALLVQREVAERVAARPGDMSLLSVSVQFYCHAEAGQKVPARLFLPMPKVDSQILLLRHTGPMFKDVDTKLFFNVVRAGFSERRKKLRSSLSGGLRIDKSEASALLEKAGISPDLRAQELSMDDWHSLYLAVHPPK